MKKYILIFCFSLLTMSLKAQLDTTSNSVYDYYGKLLISQKDSLSKKSYILLDGTKLDSVVVEEELIDKEIIDKIAHQLTKDLEHDERFDGEKKYFLTILFDPNKKEILELRLLKGSELNTSPAKLAHIASETSKKLQEKNIDFSQLKNVISFDVAAFLTCMCMSIEKVNTGSPNKKKKKRKRIN